MRPNAKEMTIVNVVKVKYTPEQVRKILEWAERTKKVLDNNWFDGDFNNDDVIAASREYDEIMEVKES